MSGYIYHGSGFESKQLKPTFHHTGELVVWDVVESNKYLYATSKRESAIDMAVASTLERNFQMYCFKVNDRKVEIFIELGKKLPTLRDIEEFDIWLYTIPLDGKWIKNNNPHNGMDTEYKTPEIISGFTIIEKVNMTGWLKNRKVIIQHDNLSKAW